MGYKRFAGIIGVLFLGAVLRFHALGQDVRFHPDEALFVSFARQAAVQGDWLLHGSLDKPPLTLYTNALALTAFGVTTLPNGVLTLDIHTGEFAARVPGVFASILFIAVMYALAKQLYPSDQPLMLYIAALLAALSPLAIAFSATAFTDGLLLLSVTIAMLMASGRRWFWSGLWLALGFWCKQQALFDVLLIIGLCWICERRAGNRVTLRKLLRFVVPLLLGIGLLFIWDSARGQATSMWELATVNNDPGRLIYPYELVPRLSAWWQYGQYLLGAGSITAVIGFFGAVCLFIAGQHLFRASTHPTRFTATFAPYWLDALLAAFVILYMAFHWLIAINIYDRYLLLILPPFVLLAARGIGQLLKRWNNPRLQLLIILMLLVIGLPPAWAASQDQLPIGGDRGQNNGIEQVADYLNSQRLGAIVYDHWLGWELSYYMGTWSDKRRVYYPTPETFAADALRQKDVAPRYFVVPDWAAADAWLEALRDAHFKVTETYHQPPFTVYELLRP